MEATFAKLAEAHDEDPVMHIESRQIRPCGVPVA
jgi:hypothetical protein